MKIFYLHCTFQVQHQYPSHSVQSLCLPKILIRLERYQIYHYRLVQIRRALGSRHILDALHATPYRRDQALLLNLNCKGYLKVVHVQLHSSDCSKDYFLP